ncbi:MAG: T9SS type A sorting domain-containing protein [Bacteroidales bacterium]|nr:T9SS type A sorting domain-containing protein [Bacteroidales bacterium]
MQSIFVLSTLISGLTTRAMYKIIALFALFVLPTFLFGQYPNITIYSTNHPSEPSICINPDNLDELVAGSNLNYVYTSNDGGYNWESNQLYSSEHGVWGDPCIVCDTAGDFYYFHLSNPSVGSWIDRIVCQKTTDLGQNWSDGVGIGLNGVKAQDKEWSVVDRKNNNIYVTWTQFDSYGSPDTEDISLIRFAKSTDGGQSFSDPVRINDVHGDCIDDDNTVEGAVPAIGPNGEIYVSWAGPEGLVFDRSTDQGETWLDEDVFVGDFPSGWNYNIPGINRCNGLPVTVCDTSNSAYRGTIYINWTDQRNGEDDTDVWISKSTDGGNSWSEAIRVNDDDEGKQQFFTWMTIDQTTGFLYFVFYDRRNYDDNNTDVYMAISKDGGDSFTNFKISESPFVPYESVFFGDYTNVTAHNGVVRPIWARLNQNVLSIMTAIIDPEIINVDNNEYQPFVLEQNYPNPFSDQTFISFKLYSPSVITLEINDVFGTPIVTILDQQDIEPGKHSYSFDADKYNLTSGVYYFSLRMNDQTMKRKMVYVN